MESYFRSLSANARPQKVPPELAAEIEAAWVEFTTHPGDSPEIVAALRDEIQDTHRAAFAVGFCAGTLRAYKALKQIP